MSWNITKASGEQEPFNVQKFRASLRHAGADKTLIGALEQEILTMPHLTDTQQIYAFALERLQKEKTGLAGRYNLKQSLFALGPAGFPFEQFVALIFKAQGYEVTTNQIVAGLCVSHEIDVIAMRDNQRHIIECKFHNHHGPKTDIKVPLYVKARFEDIVKSPDATAHSANQSNHIWVVTNTKFSTQAIAYGLCADLSLLGWSYPATHNIQDLIAHYGLHPITTLTTLSSDQKKKLIAQRLILCRDVRTNKALLKKIHIPDHQIEKICTEADEVCRVA